MVVFVEHSVLVDPLVTNHPGFNMTRDKLMSFREGKDELTDKIDFIICLGGDGTLLYASSLFQVNNILKRSDERNSFTLLVIISNSLFMMSDDPLRTTPSIIFDTADHIFLYIYISVCYVFLKLCGM